MLALLWHTCVGLLLAQPGGSAVVVDLAAEADDKVDVTLIVVLATSKNNQVEPKIECIARAIRLKEPSLTGFRLATITRETLSVGTRKKFPLVDGEEAVVELKRCTEEPKPVCLKIMAPGVKGVTYESCCGKFFPLVTDYFTKAKDRVIIAVMAETCKDEE